jgi:hypothetical protein
MTNNEVREPIKFMEEIENLIKWLIASWYWDEGSNYEQLSFMFVAGAGKGKSLIIKLFDNKKYYSIRYFILEDFTTLDVCKIIHTKVKELKCIIGTPEMNRLCSHSKMAVEQIFACLLNMLEKDGLNMVKDSHGEEHEINPIIKLSMICGITPEVFYKHFRSWMISGLLNRFIVITWNLNKTQQEQIIKYKNDLINSKLKEAKTQQLDYKMKHITINKELLNPLNNLADKMNSTLFDKYMIFVKKKMSKEALEAIREIKEREKSAIIRWQEKTLMLCVGKVISEHRNELLESDVSEVIRLLTKYTSLNYPLVGEIEEPTPKEHLISGVLEYAEQILKEPEKEPEKPKEPEEQKKPEEPTNSEGIPEGNNYMEPEKKHFWNKPKLY